MPEEIIIENAPVQEPEIVNEAPKAIVEEPKEPEIVNEPSKAPEEKESKSKKAKKAKYSVRATIYNRRDDTFIQPGEYETNDKFVIEILEASPYAELAE